MLKRNDCPLCKLSNTTKVFLIDYLDDKKYVKCMCKNCNLSVLERVHDPVDYIENIETATEAVIQKWNKIGNNLTD